MSCFYMGGPPLAIASRQHNFPPLLLFVIALPRANKNFPCLVFLRIEWPHLCPGHDSVDDCRWRKGQCGLLSSKIFKIFKILLSSKFIPSGWHLQRQCPSACEDILKMKGNSASIVVSVFESLCVGLGSLFLVMPLSLPLFVQLGPTRLSSIFQHPENKDI